MTPYRTLVFARLVQDSPLNVGGNHPHHLVNSPLARDGQGRPVLRGSTLAGCFIATARALAGALPAAITTGGVAATHSQNTLTPSAWRFAHAHLVEPEQQTAFFQHVSINARTHAAKDDHLFSLEALPTGSAWHFELEIVPTADADLAQLEALAAAALTAWTQPGAARLGRGSRHGYGWCHLEDITILRLDARHIRLWPDAFAPERSAAEWIAHFKNNHVPVLDLPALCALHPKPPHAGRVEVHFEGNLCVGERQDAFGQGYGLDTLSIGGHARMQQQAQAFFPRVIAPQGIAFSEANFDPAFSITAMPGPDGALMPYVPGASLRGVWRAQLERHYRATGGDMALLNTLFGDTERAGCLRVADATLVDDNWKLIWQQHVAIDELTGGAYESAKFDRLSLAHATFHWQACIEADSEQAAENLAAPLRKLLNALGDGHLPLGGGIWRGHGHIRWTLDSIETRPLGDASQGAKP